MKTVWGAPLCQLGLTTCLLGLVVQTEMLETWNAGGSIGPNLAFLPDLSVCPSNPYSLMMDLALRDAMLMRSVSNCTSLGVHPVRMLYIYCL